MIWRLLNRQRSSMCRIGQPISPQFGLFASSLPPRPFKQLLVLFLPHFLAPLLEHRAHLADPPRIRFKDEQSAEARLYQIDVLGMNGRIEAAGQPQPHSTNPTTIDRKMTADWFKEGFASIAQCVTKIGFLAIRMTFWDTLPKKSSSPIPRPCEPKMKLLTSSSSAI